MILKKIEPISWEPGKSKAQAIRKYRLRHRKIRSTEMQVKAVLYRFKFQEMPRKTFVEYLEEDPELVLDFGQERVTRRDIAFLFRHRPGYTVATNPHLLTRKQQKEACRKYPQLMAEHMPEACTLGSLLKHHQENAVKYKGQELTRNQIQSFMDLETYRDLLLQEIPLRLTRQQYQECVDYCNEQGLDTAGIILKSFKKNDPEKIMGKHQNHMEGSFRGESRVELARWVYRKKKKKEGSQGKITIPGKVLEHASACIAEQI